MEGPRGAMVRVRVRVGLAQAQVGVLGAEEAMKRKMRKMRSLPWQSCDPWKRRKTDDGEMVRFDVCTRNSYD